MLTADLMRVVIRGDEIRPSFLRKRREAFVSRADGLVTTWKQAVGAPRHELEAALEEIIGDDRDTAVLRGLAKLLDDRSTWEVGSPIDPVDLRRRIFEEAHRVRTASQMTTAVGEDRAAILDAVARELGVSVDAVEQGLYADLRTEQRLASFRSIDAEGLVDRYDLALVQGVLLHASELRVDLQVARAASLRAILRMVRFHQLMHRVERVSATRWRLIIDGPASLFRQSQRYGMQIATFVPWLLSLDTWALEADVIWGAAKRACTLRVASDDGLRGERKLRGAWIAKEHELLLARIAERPEGWEVADEVVVEDLGGQDALVPDLVLRHTATGRRAYVEIVGFWRRAWLERRLETLRAHGPSNLVLCVSKRMATEVGDALDAFPVVPFAEVISWPRVREAADRVAC